MPRQASLYDEGSDPDYRFTLANERTFLAWNRTALALVAAGVAIVQLLPDLGTATTRLALGVPLIVLGGVVAALSFGRWERNERAIRLDRPLPRSPLPVVLAAGVTIGALVVLVLIALEGL